jgi:hypothetical protein
MCAKLTFIRKKSMEVFVIAHYEMKQRKRERERERERETHLRKGGREGPILHTWEFD